MLQGLEATAAVLQTGQGPATPTAAAAAAATVGVVLTLLRKANRVQGRGEGGAG